MTGTSASYKNYIVILKVHGYEAIQVWNSEAFHKISPLSQQPSNGNTNGSRLGAWSSCSSLSTRSSVSTAINSNAPSRASTICSEDETDEDYFSEASLTSGSGKSLRSPKIRYVVKQLHNFSDRKAEVDLKRDNHENNDTIQKQETTIDQTEDKDKQFELIILEQPSKEMTACKFHSQSSQGQAFKVDISFGTMDNKIGKALITLDPRRCTQGVGKSQILESSEQGAPVGQIQFEYLIITDPVAFNKPCPKPAWLSKLASLDAGHRGSGSGFRADLPGSILENTVDSFNYAHRHGADMCELDVFVSADGIPAIYHDFDADIGQSQKVQVTDFTLEELRQFKEILFHEDDRTFKLDISKQVKTNRPFPTLEEVLNGVDQTCALNIEIKWPQLMQNGKLQAQRNREVNDFVGRILSCIEQHHNGRAIILSTFDADIAIMLRLKQCEFPVLFLTTGDSQRFTDPRTKTVKNGIHFAQAFDLAGINPRSDHITQYLVRYTKDRGLLVYSWGSEINSAQAILELKRAGLNGVIYDKIDLIKPKKE